MKHPEQLIHKQEEGNNIALFNSYMVSLSKLNLGTTKAHTLIAQSTRGDKEMTW